MRRWAVVLSALTVSLGAATTVAGTAANAGNDNDPYTVSNGHAQGGAAGGFVPATAAQGSNAARPGGGGASRNLIYHNGPVQHGTSVKPIFAGSAWTTTSFAGNKITGLDSLYAGLSGSSYSKTNGEYYDVTNNVQSLVDPSVAYVPGSYIIDSQHSFSSDPGTDALAAEVVAEVGTPVDGAYYPIYITGKRGSAGYCAYHDRSTYTKTDGTVVNFQVGFFFNLDGDSGCNPNDLTRPNDEGLAALANVTGHEYSEMVTDPRLTAWWDQQGNENADKCAWTFGSKLLLIGGTSWKIQGNWSNKANNAGIGYSSGRTKYVGCVDGTNPT